MLFSFPRRDLTFTLLHEEVMCTYNATTPSHKSHHQKTPGLLWGSSLGGPGTSAGVCPCTLPGQDSQGPTCLLLYSQLLSYALRSPQLVLQTSPGIQQWPPGCQERLEKCGTPPLRCLIWSTTQLEVQKHHHIFQVFPPISENQHIKTRPTVLY